jgi:hypothetical protein
MASLNLSLTYSFNHPVSSGDEINLTYQGVTVNYPTIGIYNNATITNFIFDVGSDPSGYGFTITLTPAEFPDETITGVVTSTGEWVSPPFSFMPWVLTENIQVSFNYTPPTYGCTDAAACNYCGDGVCDTDDGSCLPWVNYYCDEDCDKK